MAVTIIVILLGAYVVAESIYALNLMSVSEKACRRVKYVLAALCGLWLAAEAVGGAISWLELAQSAALALFVCPRTADRSKQHNYWPLG